MLTDILNSLGRRYQVLDKLGQGGMGTVLRAFDRLTNQHVALKRVHALHQAQVLGTHELLGQTLCLDPAETTPGLAASGMRTSAAKVSVGYRFSNEEILAFRIALAQEFRTLASLRHPNIISVLDYGFDTENQPYFTMELLAHTQPLLQALADQPLELRLDILGQVLRALDYLHRRGILHRDIKPSNVLLIGESSDYRIKLLDFGLALERQLKVDSLQEVAGTLGYIAPEVLRGEPVSEAADLYAVGVLAYELIAGLHPFGQLDGSALISMALSSEAPRAPLAANVVLADWVLRMLDRAPQQRFSSAAEALRALSLAIGKPLAVESIATRESFLQAARFVGRETELSTLSTALAQIHDGSGAVFLVGGESGVGKSRLIEELRVMALVRGMRVLRGQAQSNRPGGLELLAEALRLLVLEQPPPPLIASVLKSLLPDLSRLLGTSVEDAVPLDAQAARARLMNSIERTILSTLGPTLLLLEDLHWAGPDELEILQRLLPQVTQREILVVCTYRTEERPGLPTELAGAHSLILGRLGSRDVAALSAAILGAHSSHSELQAWLNRETEGNAFFIVEVLRALADESGSLSTIRANSLPERIFTGGMQNVLRRRMQRVPDAMQTTLHLCAVVGRHIDLALLQFFEPAWAEWLARCSESGILEMHERQWRFSHDKLREWVLGDLATEAVPPLHRRVVEGLLHTYQDSRTIAASLAYHCEKGELTSQAAHYAALAGEVALHQGALAQAVELLSRARALQGRVNAAQLTQLRTQRLLLEATFGLGRLADSESLVKEALVLAGYLAEPSTLQQATILAQSVVQQAKHRLHPSFIRALPDGERRELLEECVRIQLIAAEVRMWSSRLPAAAHSLIDALNTAERHGSADMQSGGLAGMGFLLSLTPLVSLSTSYHRRAERMLGQKVAPASQIFALRALGTGYVGLGLQNEAIDTIKRAQIVAASVGDVYGECYALNVLSWALLRWGNYAEARQVALTALAGAQQMQNDLMAGLMHCVMAVCSMHMGDLPAAVSHCQLGEQKSRRTPDSVPALLVAGIHPQVLIRMGQFDKAIHLASDGLTHLAKAQQVTHPAVDGNEGLVETFFALWQQDPGSEASRRWRLCVEHALQMLRRFGLQVRVARPIWLLWSARYRFALGDHAAAIRRLLWALKEARSMQLRSIEALVSCWLGVIRGGPRGDIEVRAGIDVLRQMQAHGDVAQLEHANGLGRRAQHL